MKIIHIVGGGTVFHIRPHLAVSAIAYGGTAKKIAAECKQLFNNHEYKVVTHLTKLASSGLSSIETNEDVKNLLEEICIDSSSKILFLPVAICDFYANIVENNKSTESGKNQPRLNSRRGDYNMTLTKADKLIGAVKKQRPDITLVGFKTTSNVANTEMLILANKLLVEAKCDFVFANDIHRRQNVIISASNYSSNFFKDRDLAINHLVNLITKFG